MHAQFLVNDAIFRVVRYPTGAAVVGGGPQPVTEVTFGEDQFGTDIVGETVKIASDCTGRHDRKYASRR